MPNTGTDLGSDLGDLMLIAKRHLPDMAEAFATAAGHVEDTGKSDDKAMAMRVRTSFQEFRNAYHGLLISTQSNLQDTSTALVMAINDYAATDAAAAEQLRARIDELNKTYEDMPNTGKGQPHEVPKYQDPDPMEEVDRELPHYPGGPTTDNTQNAPDDK